VTVLSVLVAIVQFLFGTTWTMYVIYLPHLAQNAGIGREWVPWILVADQLVFAAMDVVTGFWVDRVRAALGRFGLWLLAGTLISAVAFLALLELRRGGEAVLEQAAPFAPIRVRRSAEERREEWTARSA
jgi:MFS family permease